MIETRWKQGFRSEWLNRLYGYIPDSLDSKLLIGKARLLPWLRWRAPLTRYSGRGYRVLVAGEIASAGYFVQRIVGVEAQPERLGSVSLPRLPGALDRLAGEVDLVIARVERATARWLFDQNYLHVPETVGSVIEIPADLDAFIRSIKSHANNIARVRRNALSYRITHQPEALERFYREMYLPYIVERYGSMAFPRSRHRLYRYFQEGGLMLIQQAERDIAGSVIRVKNTALESYGLSTIPGNPEIRKLGAISASYLFRLHYAKAQGLRLLDLGSARPSLNDNVLVYKLRWRALIRPAEPCPHDLLFRWERFDAKLAQFLRDNPLIIRDGDRLSGLTAVSGSQPGNEDAASDACRRLHTHGLKRLFILSPSPWPIDHVSVQQEAPRGVLINPASSRELVNTIRASGS